MLSIFKIFIVRNKEFTFIYPCIFVFTYFYICIHKYIYICFYWFYPSLTQFYSPAPKYLTKCFIFITQWYNCCNLFSDFDWSSFYVLFRYHLGSVAFGSLLIATVRFIRVMLEYVEQKLNKYDNKLVKCLMWYVYKITLSTIKFLSIHSYIIF